MTKFLTINIVRTSCLLGAIATLCLLTTSANAQLTTTIYQDDFDGIDADLGGTTPDVSATGGAWVTANSRGEGGAAQIFSANGTILKEGPNSSHDAGALLPITLLPATVYTLETTFTNDNPNWIAAGFAATDNTLDGSNGRHTANLANFGGYAWALSRNSATDDDQQLFNGIGTVGGFAGGDFADPTAPVTFSVVLDTANPTAITADYFFNGVQQGGTQTLPAAAITNISFVGISSDGSGSAGDATASISNFSLTATTAVPEPSSLALLGLGSIGLIARRRKK